MSGAFDLRPYQREAVDALFSFFETNGGNPIVCLPTGSGKSVIQRAFIDKVLAQWPSERFLLLSHVAELLEQNASKLDCLDVGIYSAGLRKRELWHQITVAGIQSVYTKAHKMGDVSIVIVDECHLITRSSQGMYQRFFADLRKLCPHFKIVGLTATPFRLDSGPLHSGDEALFNGIAYTADVKSLIADGYLAPLTNQIADAMVDASQVKKRAGDYAVGDLERFMMSGDNTPAAISECLRLAADRNHWLVFCVGVDHANSVTDALNHVGIDAACVVGKTPKADRESRVADFRAGRFRALVSVGVLTTGFDAPEVDCIVCLRPTMSPGLWIQLLGRGMRIAPGKKDCLVLDFTGNTHTHGPIDLIEIDEVGELKTAPHKECECGAKVHPGAKACPECGAVFKKECPRCLSLIDVGLAWCPDCGNMIVDPREVRHNKHAADGELVSGNDPIKVTVDDVDFYRHEKEGKPDSLRVIYWSGLAEYREWVCLEHGGFAARKAVDWWERYGDAPAPQTTSEALSRTGELRIPPEISVQRDGKYWRVVHE